MIEESKSKIETINGIAQMYSTTRRTSEMCFG